MALAVVLGLAGCGSSAPAYRFPDGVAWTQGGRGYISEGPGTAVVAVSVADPMPVAWSTSGVYVTFIGGRQQQDVRELDLLSGKVRALPCPVRFIFADSSSPDACEGADPVGFVGDTLIDVDQQSPSLRGHVEQLAELPPGATTWRRVRIQQVSGDDQGAQAEPSDLFTGRGVVELIPTTADGQGPFAVFLINLAGAVRRLTTVSAVYAPIPGTSTILVTGTSGAADLLSEVTGRLTPAPLPAAPRSDFYQPQVEFSYRQAALGLQALPSSCASSGDCPRAPIVRWVLHGTTWHSTGRTQEGSYQSADGRVAVVQPSAYSATRIVVGGRVVARDATQALVRFEAGRLL